MAVSGGQMAVTSAFTLFLSGFQGKITHRPLCYQIFQGIGVFCPVFATPERPRITTKSDEYAIYALFSVYAVPTFMSCKSRPTYLRTYRWKDYRTDRPRDGWTTGWPAFTQDGYPYLIIYTELCT